MTSSQSSAAWSSGSATLRRIVPLVGAMLAIAALFGASASSASAEAVGLFVAGEESGEVAKQPRFEAEKYTATVKGSSTTKFTFTAQVGKYKCNNVQFSGSLAAAASVLPLQSLFLECVVLGAIFPELRMNGCEWALHTLNSGPPYVGSMDILCPTGKGIEIAFGSGGGYCTITIAAQKGLEGVSLENTGTGSSRAITANFNLTGMKYTQASTIENFCTPGEYTNGTYVGTEVFKATK